MPTLPGNSSVESIDYMTEEAFYKSDYRKLPIFPTLLEIELGVGTAMPEHDCYLVYLRFVYESRKKKVKPC